MSFLHPAFLYLMLPILIILFTMLMTQAEVLETFFSTETLEKLRVDSDQFSMKTRNALLFLMLFFIIVALSEPVLNQGSARLAVQKSETYLALPTQMGDAVKQEALKLLEQANGPEIGLLVYDTKSYLLSSPSKNHEITGRILMQYKPPVKVSKEDFNVLVERLSKVYDDTSDKRLVLVTDRFSGANPLYIEKVLKKLGVKLYILPLNSAVPSFYKALSEVSGGGILTVNTAEALLHKSDNISETKPLYFNLFIIPVGLAMLMFIIATSSFHRGEKYFVPLFLLMLMLTPASVKATSFDFQVLEKAQVNYEKGAFKKSAEMYYKYGMKYESQEAIYNSANAYYKLGDCKKAVVLYSAIRFETTRQNQMLFHNLGNAYLCMGSREDVAKAIMAYRKSLEYGYDLQTQENLLSAKDMTFFKVDVTHEKKKRSQIQKQKEGEVLQKRDTLVFRAQAVELKD